MKSLSEIRKELKEARITEANWTVKFKPTKVNGIKVDGKPITVKARASGEAIIKAAKTLGIDKKSSSIMNATVDLDEAVVTEAADNSEKKKDEKALQAQLKVIKKKKVVLNKVEAQAEKAYNASEKYKADTEKLSDELWVLMASYDEDLNSFKAYYGNSFKEAVEVAK